jgi:hypothetical protein
MLYIGNEMALVMGRRSLKVISVDDYSESSANHSHDPPKIRLEVATVAGKDEIFVHGVSCSIYS